MIYSMLSFLGNVFKVFCVYVIVLFSIPAFGQQQEVKTKKSGLSILLISDLNDSYGTIGYNEDVKDVLSKIKDIQPDIVLCAGDMVAGQKASLSLDHLQQMWSSFNETVLSPIQKLQIPFAFTMGNHDASPSFLLDRQASKEFWMHQKDQLNISYVDSAHYPFYFSFIQNKIFFISWDASSSKVPEEVKAWMSKQLKSKVARKAKGRIVFGHLPLFAIVEAKNKPGEVVDGADGMLKIFNEFKVDMYVSGHQHAYFPAYKENVVLMNSGCLGSGARKFIGSTLEPQKAYALIHIPAGTKVRDADIQGFKPISHEMISISQLPDSIVGFNGVVRRIDDSKIINE